MSTGVPEPDAPTSRQERRKARTRQALLDAAVRLTAAGKGGSATIQDITEAADLGFGTFYNYFESKDELFELASSEVLEEWGRELDQAGRQLDDPAEAFATRFRIAGRMGRTHPERARFLTELGLQALARPDGLAPRARRDLTAAFASGRLRHPAPEVALATTAGALIGLLAMQLDPGAEVGDDVVDEVTAGLLRLLGATEQDASDLVSSTVLTPRIDIED